MAPLQGSKLAFIGGGNMAGAIIGGLVAQGVDKQLITVSEPWDVNRDKLAALGVRTTTSNAEAAAEADVVVVAVKPQVTRTVCRELADAWSAASRQTFPLVVSIAAGITMASLKEWITTSDGRSANVVRVMPNTPALVGEGAAGVYASEGTSEQDKQLVNSLLAGISKQTEWVEKDELIDVITGLSGSGPAYFFAFVEHLISSATALGLNEDQAARLAKQTALGAATMMSRSDEDPGQLRRNVTSPNGTTHAALETFAAEGFKEIVDKSVRAAAARGAELGETLAKQQAHL
ncbi:hypothetical protein N3K66_000552 [Trichothecium roseum]|uniref:Uncharacterized protein n=1 Tax=Trichothecium roseum TaxID=47278 RepID=A0ACC0VE35_9HYPO|nr:hypothetical protein N3K66_000552 [Trichothecium roseum]